MDDVLEQDQYEERLKEVFDGFDASGCGSLCPEELADLCLSLHLEDVAPALLDALLQGRDRITDRVDFEQFRDALILVLSSGIEAQREVPSRPESPDIQPKFVKGSKRYGRRSKPESADAILDFCQDDEHNQGDEDTKDSDDSAVPRKRERCNANQTITEEYEAEGQMHLWNPDEPSTTRGYVSEALKERLQEACEELAISWQGRAGHTELLALCDYLGLELSADVVHGLNGDGWINVQEFVSMVLKYNKPPATPSASTPYRQLKRQHSTQPFDEVGRRIANPCALMGSVGTSLFSTLDDGTGFTAVESIIDAWMEEGIENSIEILQALNFSLEGKLSLCDLTVALENELLGTKNGIHQAALASFKAEIRHLLERVEGELREKEKIRLDLEKAERLKSQLAAEVDEHHLSIERTNHLNLRKLEDAHQEKLAAVRSQLMKEMDLIRQQGAQQCEELEAQVGKIKEDESFLRDHLAISVKENRRLETDLLDCSEQLTKAQSQVTKLQASLDNVMKEKFGELDPGSADFFLQEERIKRLRLGYEAQCRELQDRVDELQSQLQDFQSLGRTRQRCPQPLSEELESKSPGVESDPGLGSEEVLHPFISLSLEAEMMLEQQKEQHLRQMDDLRNQLETKIIEFNAAVEQHEVQKTALALQHRQELADIRSRERELQSQLELAEVERTRLEEETSSLRRRLLEAEAVAAEREEQLRNLQGRKADLCAEMEELRNQHASLVKTLEKNNTEALETRRRDWEKKRQQETEELEKSWMDRFEKEKEQLTQRHEEELTARLDEARSGLEEEHERAVKSEHNNESLQALLEEATLRLLKEQEDKEARWESERLRLGEQHERREAELKREWERERLQLEEDYEDMLREKLDEEREKREAEKEELERRLQDLADTREESHREALREMTAQHAEERNTLSEMLDKLRGDIAQERQQTEVSFAKKIKQVEDRFSGEQESAAARFQADVLKLERHYRAVAAQTNKMAPDDLRNRLHESLRAEEDFLARSDENAKDAELLLSQVVEDFRQEREEFQSARARLEAQYQELLSVSRRQTAEKISLLAERDDLKLRLEDIEKLLKQAVDDFELDRAELQGQVALLEEKLKESQSRDPFSVESENAGIAATTSIPENSFREEDLKKERKPTNEPHQDASRLNTDASETQDLRASRTRNATVLGEGCDDLETSNFEQPNDNPQADHLRHGEKIRMSAQFEFPGTFSPTPCQDKDSPIGLSGALVERKEESGPEDAPASITENPSHHDRWDTEGAFASLVIADPGEQFLDDAKADRGSESYWDDLNAEQAEVRPNYADDEPQDLTLFELQTSYRQSREESLLLQEKILLLQQKSELLQSLLEHSSKKIQTGREYLEENYSLKVKMFLLLEHVKALQVEASELKELRARYEDRVRDNATLKGQNAELKTKIWTLQSRMSDERVSLADDIGRIRQENRKLSELFLEFETPRNASDPALPRSRISEPSPVRDGCGEFAPRAAKLHRGVSEPQAENDAAWANRFKLEQLNQGKVAAEQLAENLNKEMSDLRSQSRRLRAENGMLTEKNARSLAEADQLKRQLAELIKDNDDKQEALTGEEKKELAACVRALEAELTKAVKDAARLEDRNAELAQQVSGLEEKLMEADSMENPLSRPPAGRKDAAKETRGLRKQLAKFQERVKSMDDTLQALNHQKARLRSDLRVVQQDRDSLRQEVAVLRKHLQNASDKNHILELALHESPIQSPSRKLQRDGGALQSMEQDDKVSILSLKQQQQHKNCQAMLLKALEKENASLKQEVDAQKLLIQDLAAKEGHAQLQEENEALKAELAQLTAKLLETYQVHFTGLLPTSLHRTARGHRSDADVGQDDPERRMERMEERMKEIEASLRNVKLLLREKVAQLKEQVHKNTRADVLIRDLYVENGQLLKALEVVERRRRSAERTKQLSEDDTFTPHTRVCGPSPRTFLSPSYNFECA
ncbi:ninein isoform X2 [Hippocampus zosterae]|nr:ninein isoform X2 [Hippocampus zosterae]